MPHRHASRLLLAPLRGFGLDPHRWRHQKAGKGKWGGVGLRPHPCADRGDSPYAAPQNPQKDSVFRVRHLHSELHSAHKTRKYECNIN
jgi:hypothetical protein